MTSAELQQLALRVTADSRRRGDVIDRASKQPVRERSTRWEGIVAVAEMGTLEVELHDDIVVVRLLGEHDISTSPNLTATLDSHVDEGIVVSLTETQFIDSSVVHALLVTDDRLRKRNSRLVLHVATASIVARVLEISGLSTTVPSTGSLEEALEFARRR